MFFLVKRKNQNEVISVELGIILIFIFSLFVEFKSAHRIKLFKLGSSLFVLLKVQHVDLRGQAN